MFKLFTVLVVTFSLFSADTIAKGGRNRKSAAQQHKQRLLQYAPLFFELDAAAYINQQTQRISEQMADIGGHQRNMVNLQQRARINDDLISLVESLCEGTKTINDILKEILLCRLERLFNTYVGSVFSSGISPSTDPDLREWLRKDTGADKARNLALSLQSVKIYQCDQRFIQLIFALMKPSDFDDESRRLLGSSPSLWELLEGNIDDLGHPDQAGGWAPVIALKNVTVGDMSGSDPHSAMHILQAMHYYPGGLSQLTSGQAERVLSFPLPLLDRAIESRLKNIDALIYYSEYKKGYLLGFRKTGDFLDNRKRIHFSALELPDGLKRKVGLLPPISEASSSGIAKGASSSKPENKKKSSIDSESGVFYRPATVPEAFSSASGSADVPTESDDGSSEEEMDDDTEELSAQQEEEDILAAHEQRAKLERDHPRFCDTLTQIQHLYATNYRFAPRTLTHEIDIFLDKIHHHPSTITLKDVTDFWASLGKSAQVVKGERGKTTGSHRHHTLQITALDGNVLEYSLHRPHKKHYSVGYVVGQLRFFVDLVLGRLTVE